MDTPPRDDEPLVEVTLPPALLRLFPEAPPALSVRAASVSQLLDALDKRWPGMRDRLADETPSIRRHINVFVEGRRSRLDTPLSPGAKVFIITAISGG
jgi:sulfur-carrier protein